MIYLLTKAGYIYSIVSNKQRSYVVKPIDGGATVEISCDDVDVIDTNFAVIQNANALARLTLQKENKRLQEIIANNCD